MSNVIHVEYIFWEKRYAKALQVFGDPFFHLDMICEVEVFDNMEAAND